MNPNSYQQNPIDYLDQIAPQPTKNSWLLSKKPLLIGLIIAIAILLIASVAGLFLGKAQTNSQLTARLIDTQTIVNDATKKINSTKLQALNGNLSIYLSNTVSSIEPLLTKEGVKVKEIDKNITKKETDTELVTKLEDARLNAIYDRTYSREMAYKLNTILTLMNQLKKSNRSASAKSFYSTSINNLIPIQKAFADFNESDNN